MSSPVFGANFDRVDQNFPFYYSDNLWSILDDHSDTILATDGYDNGVNSDNMFRGQENSLSAKLIENKHEQHSSFVPLEASDNPPCPLLHENSIRLPVEEDYDELNSCVFLNQQENLALTGSITEKGLLENNINNPQDHNILPSTLEAFENLCQNLGENHDARDKELQGNSANHHNHDNSLSSNCTLGGTSNESWPLLEEGSTSLNIENYENSVGFNSNILTEEAAALPAQATPSIDKGLLGQQINAKTKERNRKSKRLLSAKMDVQPNGEEGQISKKQEHNAKEKNRRMKINATFLALGALLPNHQRTKKRRSIPVMIDKALEYIPELEKKIEDLTIRKNTLLSTIEKQNLRETPQLLDKLQAPTVSLHEVVKGEVIIQIVYIQKDQETTVFSNLLQNIEAQGMSILSASTLQVCKERVCYHLHMQMNGSSLAADYIAILRERLISWLA